jgi:hypothetical protein
VIYLYGLLAAPTWVLAGLVWVLTLSGQHLSNATPDWLALSASAGVMGLLRWSHVLARRRGRPVLGMLVTVLSWLLFGATMLTWGLMHQKTWQ